MKLLKINWHFFCLSLFFFLTFNFPVFATTLYTYTGSSTLINDGGGKMRIKFLTSGTFTPANNMMIDAFLVGGGGGGGGSSDNCNFGGGGGGGGYTATHSSLSIVSNTNYSIVVGAGGGGGYSSDVHWGVTGGGTSAFGHSVSGGAGGYYTQSGGAGGSGGGCGTFCYVGGYGGSNGGAGESKNNDAGTQYGGAGQGSTTREFSEASGTLYAGGGGGGGGYNYSGGAGGSGGGATGGALGSYGASANSNTGGGGGGNGGCIPAGSYGGAGGSGIVVIRFTDSSAPTCGTWSPSTSPWKTTAATQAFTLSDSTDTGGSGINVAGGSCTTGSNNGDTCTINISDNAGNSTTCTSPINRVDTTSPTINSITADQELATPSGESVTLTVSGLADTGGSGLASLKYSYFVPGSSSWNQVTVANTNSSASFAIPITKEGTYYIKAVAIDSASNLSNEVETSIFINRGTFTASPSPSPVPSFTKPLQIKDIAKGSYVSFNNYLFVKLGNIGESGPFLAVSPLCEQPLVLTSSGILNNTNTIYTGNLPTPGQTTVALVSSPDSSMHGTCTWSSATNPSLSSITSYLDSNHCIANLNTSTTTSYTVSMTGCLTNLTTSLTVSLAEFAGE